MNYKYLGFNSEKEYIGYFLDTLLPTNHSFDFFVDWDKVYSNIEEHIFEISLLNSLSHMPADKVEVNFRKLISNNPEVVSVLPSILAIRFKNKSRVVPIFDKFYREFDFACESFDIDSIVDFSYKTGILDLFSNIRDLKAYLLGTEVGLDTNARKNRSGKLFEGIVSSLLSNLLKSSSIYSFKEQVSVSGITRTKYADFVIYKDGVPSIIIECNFYNSTGSKPIETGNAYINLQEQIESEDMVFIWISDGVGWSKLGNTLNELMPEIGYFLNYNMFKDNFSKFLDLI